MSNRPILPDIPEKLPPVESGPREKAPVRLLFAIGVSLVALLSVLAAWAAFNQNRLALIFAVPAFVLQCLLHFNRSRPDERTASKHPLAHAMPLNSKTAFVIAGIVIGSFLLGGYAWWTLSASKKSNPAGSGQQNDAPTGVSALSAPSAYQQEIDALPLPVEPAVAAGLVIPFGESGSAFVIAADETTAYTVDHYKNTVSVIDLRKGTVVSQIAGPKIVQPEKDHCIRYRPCGGLTALDIAVTQDKSIALVTSMHKNAVTFIDVVNGRILKKVMVGKMPNSILLSPDQARAYVHNTAERSISVLDMQRREVVATLQFEIGKSSLPEDRIPMWLSTNGTRLHALDASWNYILEFDTATFQLIDQKEAASIAAWVLPTGLNWSMGLSSDGVINLFDGMESRNNQRWELCNGNTVESNALAVHPSGGRESLAAITTSPGLAERSSFVHVVNLDSQVSRGRFPVDSHVIQMKFSDNGKRLFALTSQGTLSVLTLDQRLADDKVLCGKSLR